jgi:hypothetical protein
VPAAPSPSPSPTPTPQPQTAILVSDNQNGAVLVVDPSTSAVKQSIPASSPGKMVSAGGVTVIQNTAAANVAIFDDTKQEITSNVALSAMPLDVAITPDGKHAWIIESNGAIQAIDTAAGTATAAGSAPGASRLVMSPGGTRLLVFSDDAKSQPIANSFSVLLPPSAGVSTVADPTLLDQPFNGVFITDDQFWLLNCGSECGGAKAGIVSVNLFPADGGGPALGTPTPVRGATVALLDKGTLYVAGSSALATPNGGNLQFFSSATGAALVGPISIPDGLHLDMVLAPGGRAGKIYIGSRGCGPGPVDTNGQREGCLAILDIANQTVELVMEPASQASYDITCILPVPGTTLVYVCSGGNIEIFDSSIGPVSTAVSRLDIAGRVLNAVVMSQ